MLRFLTKASIFSLIIFILMYNLEGTRSLQDHLLKKKWTALEHQAGDVNTIFIGTSKTYRGIDVAYFDSLMAYSGYLGKSFNLGMPGADLLEMQYLVEKILAQNFYNLKTIVLEVNDLSVVKLNNTRTARIVNYHDAKRAVMACNAVWETDYPLSQKLELIKGRLSVLSHRFFRAGALKTIWQQQFRKKNLSAKSKAFYLNYTGYEPSEKYQENTELSKNRRFFLSEEGKQAYQGLLNNNHPGLNEHRMHCRQTQKTTLEIVEDIRKQCKHRGIKVLLLNMPLDGSEKFVLKNLAASKFDDLVIDLDSREKYPEFFARENRYDLFHFNHKGALLLTKTFAKFLTKHVK